MQNYAKLCEIMQKLCETAIAAEKNPDYDHLYAKLNKYNFECDNSIITIKPTDYIYDK